METLFQYVAPPSECSYLPDKTSCLRYEFVASLSAAEYESRMMEGWRRFGRMLFKPTCRSCNECRSIRVLVKEFQPNRSQRRCLKANGDEIEIVIGSPDVSEDRLDLYDRYHSFQADFKGWPFHGEKQAYDYAESFVNNPFPTEEWRYYLHGELIALGYVDALPNSMSAIYFFYEPEQRDRSLGTYNVLCILEEARKRGLDYVCLGYFVEGCRSMEYKRRFRPHQLLEADGKWHLNE